MFMDQESYCSNQAFPALISLCDPFGDGALAQRGTEVIDAGELPPTYRRLLDHTGHMTATLKEHYGGEIVLRVLAYLDEWPWYRRKIVLAAGPSNLVVEFGIVHLDLRALNTEVRREVLQRSKPLGDILNEHGVHTRVTPKWFLRFGPDSSIGEYLPQAKGGCFGRMATIHCNGAAAIELLEVVSDITI
jgi:hypothetical protein